MLHNVFLKTLRDQRRALLWWVIGLIALALYMSLFYPSIRDNAEQLNAYMKAIPDALKATFLGGLEEITSPTGFLNAELFFFTVPLLFLIYTIGFGSGTIAGEEEQGTLELLLSNPLSRWRVAGAKFAALVVCLVALGFTLWLGLLIGGQSVSIEISAGRMAEAITSGVLLGLVFGALALALGCATGKRGLSMGVASAIAVAAYFLNSLGPMLEALKPYRKLSPFYYYIEADPLTNGLNLGHAAVLIGLIVVFLVLALLTFERRDLAV